MIFNGTKHLIAYCMAILKNQGVQLNRDDVKVFNSINYILNYLDDLKSMGAIFYNVDNFYNNVAEKIKQGGFYDITSYIRWAIKEIKKQVESKAECGNIIKSIEYKFKMDLCFTEDFILNHRGDSIYPDKIMTLVKYDVTDKIHPYIKHGKKTTEDSGVYFIYDKEGELAYIGMSGIVDQRCLQSVTERNLYNFSKIEIYSTKTRADAGIYEIYYIHKLKPYINKGINKDTGITLPDLSVTRTIEKSLNLDYIEFSCSYFKEKVMNTECALESLGDNIFIKNKHNRDVLLGMGYKSDEYHTRLSAYQESVEKMKGNEVYKECHILMCDTNSNFHAMSTISDVLIED